TTTRWQRETGSGLSMGIEGVRRGRRIVYRDNRRHVAAGERRHQDRTTNAGRGAGEGWLQYGRRPLAALTAAAMAATTALVSPIMVGPAQAQRVLAINTSRTASITVAVGKSEDVRIDVPFTEVTVGDPEVADVTPLTDHTLSVL